MLWHLIQLGLESAVASIGRAVPGWLETAGMRTAPKSDRHAANHHSAVKLSAKGHASDILKERISELECYLSLERQAKAALEGENERLRSDCAAKEHDLACMKAYIASISLLITETICINNVPEVRRSLRSEIQK